MQIPIAHSIASLERLLKETIPLQDVPARIDMEYLRESDFTATNDRDLITICRLLGIIDTERAPTDTWLRHRNGDRRALQKAVAATYAPIFSSDERPYALEDPRVVAWFREHAKSQTGFSRAVGTYRRPCLLSGIPLPYASALSISTSQRGQRDDRHRIVIALPADQSYDQYVAIFRAARQELVGPVQESTEAI